VALFIKAPERHHEAHFETLRARYRLTVTESRIATELGTGRSVAHIADACQINRTRVRWHIKQILTKVNVRSQTALVRTIVRGLEIADHRPLPPAP
jgi:DNA-binding NarL/FixJ family response regulator